MEQSRLLGEWLRLCGRPIHHLIAGTMKRHFQTAEAFFAAYGDTPDWRDRLKRNQDFNECDHRDVFGRWVEAEDPQGLGRDLKFSDMTPSEFAIKMPSALNRWTGGVHNADYRESWPAFAKRCLAALDDAAAMGRDEENVLVFTSGGTISAICQHILGAPPEQVARMALEVANGSVTCVRRGDDGRYSLNAFNERGHLDRMGRPELITIK